MLGLRRLCLDAEKLTRKTSFGRQGPARARSDSGKDKQIAGFDAAISLRLTRLCCLLASITVVIKVSNAVTARPRHSSPSPLLPAVNHDSCNESSSRVTIKHANHGLKGSSQLYDTESTLVVSRSLRIIGKTHRLAFSNCACMSACSAPSLCSARIACMTYAGSNQFSFLACRLALRHRSPYPRNGHLWPARF